MMTVLNLTSNGPRLEYASEEDHIRFCIQDLLSTRVGSRRSCVGYGSRLDQFLFKPVDKEWIIQIELEVRKVIRDFEQRIDNVEVSVQADTSGEIRVHLDYRIKSTQGRSKCIVFLDAESCGGRYER